MTLRNAPKAIAQKWGISGQIGTLAGFNLGELQRRAIARTVQSHGGTRIVDLLPIDKV
jgi:hypothetical protein